MLMPCFKVGEGFAEGIIIGRLLAGYGELELEMCACIIAVEGILDTPIRDIFTERRAKERINIAKRRCLPEYTKANLQAALLETLDGMEWCRLIRNQYAHCHWYWTKQEGLCFVNLEETAKQITTILAVTDNRHPIDVPLLESQEFFFNYVKESYWHLASSYQDWNRRSGVPRLATHIFPKPPKVNQPLLHN